MYYFNNKNIISRYENEILIYSSSREFLKTIDGLTFSKNAKISGKIKYNFEKFITIYNIVL